MIKQHPYYDLNSVCMDCAKAAGFRLKPKCMGVWHERCDVCGEFKPTVDLVHDYFFSSMTRRKQMKKQIERLDDWEWTTLVAAWRYYEYRATITSSMFPADIIRRFWASGKYAESALDQIANQFAYVDHRDEEDWTKLWSDSLHDCDKLPWCKFFAFCNAWRTNGFKTLMLDNGKGHREECEAFRCEYTGKWHPKKSYIENPLQNFWCPEEFIKEIK